MPSSFQTTICMLSQVLCPLDGVNQHSTLQKQAPVHRSPVTPFVTENKIIWFTVYIRNSARQPVQTKATTQEMPPHLAVLINADHLHTEKVNSLRTTYVTGLESRQKPPETQRGTRSAFYLVSLSTFVCLCNISLDKCRTC